VRGLVPVVLDIGNVLLRWDPEGLAADTFPDPEARRRAVEAVLAHPDWIELDRGTLSPTEVADRGARRSGLDRGALLALIERVPEALEPIPETVACAAELAARGHPLHLLSNIAAHTWDGVVRRHDFWKHFDVRVLSCHCGAAKPEPAIYRRLIDDADLRPGAAVFVDDLAANVEAGRRAGLRVLRFEDPATSLPTLRRLLEAH
jgi:putative hydrolase of the HAD superfamily